jgi:hypothetical protein
VFLCSLAAILFGILGNLVSNLGVRERLIEGISVPAEMLTAETARVRRLRPSQQTAELYLL